MQMKPRPKIKRTKIKPGRRQHAKILGKLPLPIVAVANKNEALDMATISEGDG